MTLLFWPRTPRLPVTSISPRLDQVVVAAPRVPQKALLEIQAPAEASLEFPLFTRTLIRQTFRTPSQYRGLPSGHPSSVLRRLAIRLVPRAFNAARRRALTWLTPRLYI